MESNSDNIRFGLSSPWVFIPLTALTVVFLAAAYVTSVSNPNCITQDIQKWGQFGDAVGGILNPLVAFFALLILIKSYVVQNNEFRKTSESLTAAASHSQQQVELLRHQIATQGNTQMRAEILQLMRITSDRLHEALNLRFSESDLTVNAYLAQVAASGSQFPPSLVTKALEKLAQSKAATLAPIAKVKRETEILAALIKKLESIEPDPTFRSFYTSSFPNVWILIKSFEWNAHDLIDVFGQPDELKPTS